MELSDLLQQAQVALNAEDYPRAVAACEHVLASYPACLSAHRVLGQALLEQGVVDDAIAQFASTLNLDPLDIVARLSFGVATVERNDPRMALAHYQRAWDLDPRLDQVRDELIRILSGLDADAQLHPSRAGLASIHARNGELDRAASEWRAVLAAEPADDRAPVALAEVLWRKGDDAEAIAACRDALKRAPRNARALAILAEIEHRRNALAAHETISRYHALDPGNDIVAALASDENANGLSFLIQPAAIADFHYTPVTVAVGRSVDSAGIESANPPHGGGRPAPDLWAPGDDDQSAQAVVPFDWDAAEADTPAFPVAPGTAPFADLFDGAEEESEPAAPSVGAAAAASDAGAASDTEAAAPALDGWDEIGRALSGSGSRYGSAAEAEVSEATAEAADLPQPTAEPLVAAEPEASAPSPATELELDPEPVGIEALAATKPVTNTAADPGTRVFPSRAPAIRVLTLPPGRSMRNPSLTTRWLMTSPLAVSSPGSGRRRLTSLLPARWRSIANWRGPPPSRRRPPPARQRRHHPLLPPLRRPRISGSTSPKPGIACDRDRRRRPRWCVRSRR